MYGHSGLMKLSVEQKCDIAAREVEVLREEMARKDKEYEQLLDSYKVQCMYNNHYGYQSFISQATSAEAEIRLGEVKKEVYEFERDVTRGGVNPVSDHIILLLFTVLLIEDW